MVMLNLKDQFHVTRKNFEAAYLELHRSGELWQKAQEATQMLKSCEVCPRDCVIDRLKDEKQVCKTGRYAIVSSFFPHFGEENCLRGNQGSGTIFFSMCNLRFF